MPIYIERFKDNNFKIKVYDPVIFKKDETVNSITLHLNKILEKPKNRYLVNTGLYTVNPKILKLIPKNTKIDFIQLIQLAKAKKFKIKNINSKIHKRNPSAPFTTSTLQHSASGKFGFGASRTMQIAQRVYQGIDIEGETTGLITYMRTDGTQISKESIVDFRNLIEKNFGKE